LLEGWWLRGMGIGMGIGMGREGWEGRDRDGRDRDGIGMGREGWEGMGWEGMGWEGMGRDGIAIPPLVECGDDGRSDVMRRRDEAT